MFYFLDFFFSFKTMIKIEEYTLVLKILLLKYNKYFIVK